MKKIIGVILIAGFAFYACEKGKKTERKPLARVGKVIITEEELKSQLPELASQFLREEEKSQILNLGIEATVFYLAAKDEGLLEDPQVRDRVEWMKRLLVADEYFKRKVQSNIIVTETEITDFYERYKNDFQKEIDIAYVIGRKREDVEEAKKKMERMSPIKVITELQQNPDIAADILKGVNLGGLKISMGILPQPMTEAIFSLKVGEMSSIMEIPPGQYGFVRVLDETKASASKEEIMGSIRSFLLVQKAQMKKDSIFNVLKEKYRVEIFKK